MLFLHLHGLNIYYIIYECPNTKSPEKLWHTTNLKYINIYNSIKFNHKYNMSRNKIFDKKCTFGF